MLFIFGGLPGTGKSTLAAALAQRLGATYLRIDSIEQVLKISREHSVGPVGYEIAQNLAFDNLRLGNQVVADCVNPGEASRRGWSAVAERAGCRGFSIEVRCSDLAQHQERVEKRLAGSSENIVPTWAQVAARHFDTWPEADLVFDTSDETQEQSTERFLAAVERAVADT